MGFSLHAMQGGSGNLVLDLKLNHDFIKSGAQEVRREIVSHCVCT